MQLRREDVLIWLGVGLCFVCVVAVGTRSFSSGLLLAPSFEDSL